MEFTISEISDADLVVEDKLFANLAFSFRLCRRLIAKLIYKLSVDLR
ncbi:MAG TPA: hypothetical protein VJJ21_00670 [Candidatus Nanoarchaeia archaeon]|nr:hypothetical protein [Candidatus Nanoarchaeia archaeon]